MATRNEDTKATQFTMTPRRAPADASLVSMRSTLVTAEGPLSTSWRKRSLRSTALAVVVVVAVVDVVVVDPFPALGENGSG